MLGLKDWGIGFITRQSTSPCLGQEIIAFLIQEANMWARILNQFDNLNEKLSGCGSNSLDLMLSCCGGGIKLHFGGQSDEQVPDPGGLDVSDEIESRVSIEHGHNFGQVESDFVDQMKPNGPSSSEKKMK